MDISEYDFMCASVCTSYYSFIYCREEYILLQPKFVLPEFVMQVKFHRNLAGDGKTSASMGAAGSSSSSSSPADPPPKSTGRKGGKSHREERSAISFSPFAATKRVDCSLGRSNFLQCNPLKLVSPGDGESPAEPMMNGATVGKFLANNEMESQLKVTGLETVYTDINDTTSLSPRRLYPKQAQAPTVFDDIEEDIQQLGSGSGSDQMGVYTTSTNANSFAASVAVGKRKQELCSNIGRTIVTATEQIKATV